MVEDGQDDTKQHLEDAKDDGHFHLVRVGKDKLVVRYIPDLLERSREMFDITIISRAFSMINLLLYTPTAYNRAREGEC